MRVDYYFELFTTRTELPREGRSLLFSGIHRYALGSPRRLQEVPYVIPRPGVPRHIIVTIKGKGRGEPVPLIKFLAIIFSLIACEVREP